jgi:hypothetical protein
VNSAIVELATVHFDIIVGCQLHCVGCANSTILDKVTLCVSREGTICSKCGFGAQSDHREFMIEGHEWRGMPDGLVVESR